MLIDYNDYYLMYNIVLPAIIHSFIHSSVQPKISVSKLCTIEVKPQHPSVVFKMAVNAWWSCCSS